MTPSKQMSIVTICLIGLHDNKMKLNENEIKAKDFFLCIPLLLQSFSQMRNWKQEKLISASVADICHLNSFECILFMAVRRDLTGE